jgi:hypothetical protein
MPLRGLSTISRAERSVRGPRGVVVITMRVTDLLAAPVALHGPGPRGSPVLLAGLGFLTGNILARAVAVLLAIIAINVFVIYALTAHGGELRG